MRLSEIADRLADLEGRDSDEIHIRLRNPLIKGLLSGTEGRTRNSPADYGREELYRARILLALFDCGLSTSELAIVNDALNGALVAVPLDRSYPNGLHSIIRGANEGENWTVQLRFKRTSDGYRRVSVWVGPESAILPEGRGSKAVDMLNGETHLGTLSVPASDLIRPFIGVAD